MRSVALGVVALALPVPALAQTASADAVSRGVELRRSGRPAEAIPLLEQAVQARQDDADAWLNLGLAYSATGRFDAAERALQRVLQLAPDYADARIALARLAYFRGDLAEADRRLEPVLEAHPDNAEAKELKQRIAAAHSAGAGAGWRADVAYTHAWLGKGLPDAETTVVALSRSFSGHRAVSVAVDHTRQFGQSDTYVEGQLAVRYGYIAVGGTPGAQFRPKWAVRGGLFGPAWAPAWAAGWTVQPMLDAAWGRYVVGDVRSANVGVDLAHGDGLGFSARWVNVLDERDQYLSGYTLRGAWRPVGRLQLWAGWADTPENTTGITERVKTASAGVAYDLSPRTTLRLSGAHEIRPAYDRDDLTLALTQRF